MKGLGRGFLGLCVSFFCDEVVCKGFRVMI